MSMGEELMGEFAFERDYPYGVPNVCCPVWKTKNGECIAVTQMSVLHIMNCMKLVGEDDPWFGVFAQEIIKRAMKGSLFDEKAD